MKISKRLVEIVVLVSINLLLIWFLHIAGFLMVYLGIGLGIGLGLAISEGVGSNKELFWLIFWIIFWVSAIIVIVYDDFYKIKMLMFRIMHRIDENKIEKWLNEYFNKEFNVSYAIESVKVSYVNGVKLYLVIRDYDKIVENAKSIKDVVSKKFKISRDKIDIIWDDRWRYNL